MSTLFNSITLGVVVGAVFLLTLLNLRWGVVLLTVIALINVFLEKLFPIELDLLMGFVVLTGFLVRFTLRKEQWRRSVLDLPVLILILAGVVTLTAMAFRGSDYFGEMASQVISLTMIMGMSLGVFQILRDPETIKQTLQAFTVTITAIGLLGIVTLSFGIQSIQIGGVELVLYRGWGSGGAVRLGGIYEQPNTFAMPLVLALPVSVAFALTGRSKVQQCLWASAGGICAVALLISQSRSGVLGAFLGMLVMGLILVKEAKLTRLIRYIFVIGLIVYGTLAVTGMLNPVLERLSPAYQLYQLEMGRPEENRLLIWQRALTLAFQNPFGYGAETKYLIGESFGIERKSVHNVFLSSLAGLGWLGFMGILLLAIVPMRQLRKFVHIVDNVGWKVIGTGLFAGLIGFWVHNFFHSIIHWIAVWIYFACVAATIQLRYISKAS